MNHYPQKYHIEFNDKFEPILKESASGEWCIYPSDYTFWKKVKAAFHLLWW